MRPSTFKATFYYQHQLPQTVEIDRNHVASMLRSARREKRIVEKRLSSGALANKYKINDGSTEIGIIPDESHMPSHIMVFYLGKNDGWATIVKNMMHQQMGAVQLSFRKGDAVAWAKRLQTQYMDSGERRGMPPMPIHVFTKKGVERVLYGGGLSSLAQPQGTKNEV